jgi:glycerophosphoryl diester phosphodiesterase
MKLTQLATGLLLAGLMTGSALAADKIVIAHRGASGYLPEHTLPAMAYAQGRITGAGSGDDEGRPAGRPA